MFRRLVDDILFSFERYLAAPRNASSSNFGHRLHRRARNPNGQMAILHRINANVRSSHTNHCFHKNKHKYLRCMVASHGIRLAHNCRDAVIEIKWKFYETIYKFKSDQQSIINEIPTNFLHAHPTMCCLYCGALDLQCVRERPTARFAMTKTTRFFAACHSISIASGWSGRLRCDQSLLFCIKLTLAFRKDLSLPLTSVRVHVSQYIVILWNKNNSFWLSAATNSQRTFLWTESWNS